jgi:hypothetical protein
MYLARDTQDHRRLKSSAILSSAACFNIPTSHTGPQASQTMMGTAHSLATESRGKRKTRIVDFDRIATKVVCSDQQNQPFLITLSAQTNRWADN